MKKVADALHALPRATRLIVFSDGSPTDSDKREHTLGVAKKLRTPIDTVFISTGHANPEAIKKLKELSDATDGIFIHFDSSKVNFKDAFKYLSPGKRLMLTNGDFKAKLERGEV